MYNVAINFDFYILILAGDNIGVIAGPLVAIIVIIMAIIVAVVVVLICKKYRNSSKLSSG